MIALLSLGQHKALPGGGAPSLPAAPWAQTPPNSSPGRYQGAEVGQLTRGARRTAVAQENDRAKGRRPPGRPVTAGSPRRPPRSAASAPPAAQKRAGRLGASPPCPGAPPGHGARRAAGQGRAHTPLPFPARSPSHTSPQIALEDVHLAWSNWKLEHQMACPRGRGGGER